MNNNPPPRMKEAICTKCGKNLDHMVPDDAELLICADCDRKDHHNTLMTVCARLTQAERELIVMNFIAVNPHWRGAHVEDIIDTLDDHDSYINEMETAWEQFPTLREQNGFRIACLCVLSMRAPILESYLKRLMGQSK